MQNIIETQDQVTEILKQELQVLSPNSVIHELGTGVYQIDYGLKFGLDKELVIDVTNLHLITSTEFCSCILRGVLNK